jgi:hypothetical protein
MTLIYDSQIVWIIFLKMKEKNIYNRRFGIISVGKTGKYGKISNIIHLEQIYSVG